MVEIHHYCVMFWDLYREDIIHYMTNRLNDGNVNKTSSLFKRVDIPRTGSTVSDWDNNDDSSNEADE